MAQTFKDMRGNASIVNQIYELSRVIDTPVELLNSLLADITNATITDGWYENQYKLFYIEVILAAIKLKTVINDR